MCVNISKFTVILLIVSTWVWIWGRVPGSWKHVDLAHRLYDLHAVTVILWGRTWFLLSERTGCLGWACRKWRWFVGRARMSGAECAPWHRREALFSRWWLWCPRYVTGLYKTERMGQARYTRRDLDGAQGKPDAQSKIGWQCLAGKNIQGQGQPQGQRLWVCVYLSPHAWTWPPCSGSLRTGQCQASQSWPPAPQAAGWPGWCCWFCFSQLFDWSDLQLSEVFAPSWEPIGETALRGYLCTTLYQAACTPLLCEPKNRWARPKPGFRSRRLQAPGFQLLIGSHPL